MNTKELFKKKDNIFYLVLFLLSVAVLIVISLIVRSVQLVENSTFRLNSFTVLILADKGYLVNVDRSLHQLSEATENVSARSLVGNSVFVNSITLGVPLDGEIIQDQNDSFGAHFLSSYYTIGNTLKVLVTHTDNHFIHMDPYDFLKLYFSTKGVPNTSINQTTLSQTSDPTNTILNTLFKDETIINEKVSVEVINDTDTTGLGSRVAQMLENGGYNIVSVTSGDITAHSKIIYRIPSNVTVEHLLHVVPFPSEFKNEVSIADISVILGEDYASLKER